MCNQMELLEQFFILQYQMANQLTFSVVISQMKPEASGL